VKANQKTLYRQIGAQFQGKRHIPFVATDHDPRQGRHTTRDQSAKKAPDHIWQNWHGASWIVELNATSTRVGKPFKASHPFITSLRTTAEALLRLVRERWNIES
jgi:hypothetical protein